MDLKAGYVCDRGLNPKRPVNQDRYLAIPQRGLFAVFDGVGGQRAGEVASQTAAETIEEAFIHHSADGSPADLIRRAIDFANRDVFELAESNAAYKTMATTVAMLHVDGNRATVAHVGDSRVYRLEDGRFYRETVDHTDLNDDIRSGRIGKEQAAVLETRNVINRALGVESNVEVEMKTITVRDSARFLLCSDGIYSHMSDEEIARVLTEKKDPQRAADELKRIVHQRGADDNLTAIVVQMGRARQSLVIAIDDGIPDRAEKRPVSAGASDTSPAAARSGRIQVEFDRQPPNEGDWDRRRSEKSGSRGLMYTLLVLVLIVGAFYAGLRAPDSIKMRASNPNAAKADPLQIGRDAFERGDYKVAAGEFAALSKREPSNTMALYWLGRALLEDREYASAAKSFDEATLRQPSLYDAYVWQASSYEALGERAKAAAALARYAEERRKTER